MCKGAEVQTEAFEKLEVMLSHSHAQHGPGAYCSWRPWADVGNRALRNYLGCFTLCLTAGDRELLVTGALGRRKRPLKCSKSSQFNSLGRASLFFYFCSAGLATHLHTRGIIFFLRSAESQTTSSSLTCANTHLLVFPLLPVPHTCPSPSWGSHPRTLQASAVTTSDELFPRRTSGEVAFCAAVGLLE